MKQQSIRDRILSNQTQYFGSNAFQSKDFQGDSPPSVFVSWNNYPNVMIAPMSLPEQVKDADLFDNPERWLKLTTEDIFTFRQSLIRGNQIIRADKARDPSRQLQEIQEIAMAKKPLDVELALHKKPVAKMEFNSVLAPMGPQAALKSLQLQENASVHKKVDYLVSDGQVKSMTAIEELFQAGIPTHSLYKLLSAGLLGVQKERKLVPTKWSITAIDSNVSKHLVEEVKQFQELGEIQVYHSNHFFNSFYIMLVPGSFAFELMEAWQAVRNGKVTHQIGIDYEFFKGRKKYANNTAGAYYAARLAVAEHLKTVKRQSHVIIFREISPEYTVPVGVWEIRQNVRNAMKQKALRFSDLKLALHYLENKLTIPMKEWLHTSKLIDALKNQKRITDYT